MRKTKIICTIGPSTSGLDNLIKLIETGMNAARLNFSHGTHEDHLDSIKNIREASKITGIDIPIIQDLQGPKIRTAKVENGAVTLVDGQQFIITIDDLEFGNAEKVSTVYKNLINEVKPGNTILLDDGYLILIVEKITKNDIITKVIKGGNLKDHKGIIAPGVSSSAPSMSEKDIDDLKFGLASGVDAVALSFVRSERDIIELKSTMRVFGRTVPIISKIERYEGVQSIESIINESDAIMVARGDLGLEMPAEQVPVIQKEIIEKCNFSGKTVIVATQMLESMINNPRPTRAEASDVANAVIDGGDCVMLSGETSVGKYPFDTVDYMNRIILAVETKYCKENYWKDNKHKKTEYISDALGNAACVIADQINASSIVTITHSGYTAKNIAKYRPNNNIIAFTHNINTARTLSLIWGVFPVYMDDNFEPDDTFENIGELLKSQKLAATGDYIVVVAGHSKSSVSRENIIKVIKL